MKSTTTIFAGLVASLLVPAVSARAQTPPAYVGLVPPREIIAIVHSSGLDPVGRPAREGPTYVVRAIDRRGLLMRVVVDARSGQIRAVNRIVPGPGSPGDPGPIAMRRPLPPYGPPPEFDAPPEMMPDEYGDMPPMRPARAPVVRAPVHSSAAAKPPLPRPRPANVAAETAPPVESKPPDPAAATPQPAVLPPVEKPPPAKPAPINE